MKINIAYAPDDKYINQTVVSMISAIENNKEHDIEFLILYSNLKDENITKLQNTTNLPKVKLRMLQIDESIFNNLPLSKWVTVQAWFRIKLPD